MLASSHSPTRTKDGSKASQLATSSAGSTDAVSHSEQHFDRSTDVFWDHGGSETADDGGTDASDVDVSDGDANSQISGGIITPVSNDGLVDKELEDTEVQAELWSVREVTVKPADGADDGHAGCGLSVPPDLTDLNQRGDIGKAHVGGIINEPLQSMGYSFFLHIIECSDPRHRFDVPTLPKYFEIKRSNLGGLGVFALRDLKKDDKIWVEQAMLHTTWEKFGDEYDILTPEQKTLFERMHAHIEYEDQWRAFAIWKTNNFLTKNNRAGFFPVAARFNHACKPMNNVCYWYDVRKDVLNLVMNQDVKAGTELTISYSPEGPQALYRRWGFVCHCGACASLSDDEKARIDSKDAWRLW